MEIEEGRQDGKRGAVMVRRGGQTGLGIEAERKRIGHEVGCERGGRGEDRTKSEPTRDGKEREGGGEGSTRGGGSCEVRGAAGDATAGDGGNKGSERRMREGRRRARNPSS